MTSIPHTWILALPDVTACDFKKDLKVNFFGFMECPMMDRGRWIKIHTLAIWKGKYLYEPALIPPKWHRRLSLSLQL